MELFSGLVRMALLLTGCWLTALAELALLVAGANELLGLGWWADGYPGVGGDSFAALALVAGVLAMAGLGLGAAVVFEPVGPREPRATSPDASTGGPFEARIPA